MTFWENFKDWVYTAWSDHPLYTLMFGGVCFLVGSIIL